MNMADDEGDKLYKCGHCGVTSASIDELKLHMVTTHLNDAGALEMEAEPSDHSIQTGHEHVEHVEVNIPLVTNQVVTSDNQVIHLEAFDPTAAAATAVGVPTSSASMVQAQPKRKRVDPSKLPGSKVDLSFSVHVPDSELPFFPRHVKPALYFTCEYCDYKHPEFTNVSNHVTDVHPRKLPQDLRSRPRMEFVKDDGVDNSAYTDGRQYKSENLTGKTRRQDPMKLLQVFSCDICPMRCANEQELRVHKNCHIDGSEAMRCCVCQKDAPGTKPWYALMRHILSKHPGVVPPRIECSICKKGFVKEYDLEKHASVHNNHRPFLCNHCGDAFKSEIRLKEHGILLHQQGTAEQREKLEERRRKRFLAKKNNSLPVLMCSQCGYRTKEKYQFKVHMNNHNGIKDFKCKYCDYKTADSSSLNRHMWRHRDTKPYSCRLCTFSCIQRTQMMAHYKNKHSLVPQDARKLITHINGPRTAAVPLTDEERQAIELSEQTAQVVTSTAHAGAINIIGQDEGGNPIDIHLITEAAEGLLAASQIEIHTT